MALLRTRLLAGTHLLQLEAIGSLIEGIGSVIVIFDQGFNLKFESSLCTDRG